MPSVVNCVTTYKKCVRFKTCAPFSEQCSSVGFMKWIPTFLNESITFKVYMHNFYNSLLSLTSHVCDQYWSWWFAYGNFYVIMLLLPLFLSLLSWEGLMLVRSQCQTSWVVLSSSTAHWWDPGCAHESLSLRSPIGRMRLGLHQYSLD